MWLHFRHYSGATGRAAIKTAHGILFQLIGRGPVGGAAKPPRKPL